VETYDNSTVYGYGVNWGVSGPVYSVYNNSNFYYGGTTVPLRKQR